MWNITEKIAEVGQILIYCAIAYKPCIDLIQMLYPCTIADDTTGTAPDGREVSSEITKLCFLLMFKVVFCKADGMIVILVALLALWLTSRLYPTGVCVMQMFVYFCTAWSSHAYAVVLAFTIFTLQSSNHEQMFCFHIESTFPPPPPPKKNIFCWIQK